MVTVEELARSWLAEAETLEKHGDERGAGMLRTLSGELQEALRQHRCESLSLSEAAEESGYSTDHLRHLVADGTIPNAGRKGAPRIRRADLPLKPGTTATAEPGSDVEADADEIVRSIGGAA